MNIMIKVDGVNVWPTTHVMSSHGETFDVDIPVAGAQELQIIVDPIGTVECDDLTWVNAHFLRDFKSDGDRSQ